MNRLEWILGILLVVLLVAVAALALTLWLQPDNPVAGPIDSAPVRPANVAAPTSVFPGQTAQIAYVAAQRSALDWQADARLLNATTTWPQGTEQGELLSGEAPWNFTFHSPGAGRNAVIAVVDDQAELVTELASEEKGSLADVVSWNVDSRQVIEQFINEGGGEFMARERVTTMTMALSMENEDGRIEWFLLLISPVNGNTFSMRVDATSGQILDLEPGRTG